MLNESLLKKQFIGRDGFIWWIGQVCEAGTWAENAPALPVANISDLPGFKRRVKVSILGYHTASKDDLKNEDLPWAYVLMPPTAGGGMGGGSESLNFTGGEWVFGFFLDGEDAQQPVVLGVFGKSSQVDFRKDIPNTRFEPFSGFSNGAVEPLTNIKQDESVSKTPTGTPDVSLGNNGVKVTKTLANEAAAVEASTTTDIRPKASKTQHDNAVATGDMSVADPSDQDDPLDSIDKTMKRISKVTTQIKEFNNLYVDSGMNQLFNMEGEQKRAGDIIAGALKTVQEKVRAKTLEATSKASSNIATSAPLSKMPAAKDAQDKATQAVSETFNNLIGSLVDLAGDFVSDTGNKLATQPPCVVEDYVGGLLGNALGAVDGAVNSAMGDVNNVLASVDAAGQLVNQGLGAAKRIQDAQGVGEMLTEGLNAFGGISIDLDGVTKFTSSFEKLLKGEKTLPAPSAKGRSILGGADPLKGTDVTFDNVLENVASSISAVDQLKAGISNFADKSIFSTGINLDNLRSTDLGGIGGISDALDKAKNLDVFKNLPGTTGESVIEATKSLLEGGDTLDAAISAADIIYPGSGQFVKSAFEVQKQLGRLQGGSCDTGPSLNGPPKVEIFGGTGNGATANAIIGPNGNLLAVDLTRSGKGWKKAPFVIISDSSGKGKGAVAQAVLEPETPENRITGRKIEKIKVISPGHNYLQSPDGSVGGNGRVFAEKGDTILKDKDGNYYSFKPGTGIKVPPGGALWFPAGSRAELPTSASVLDGDLLAPEDKTPRKIKSIQIDEKRGFKGFAKVTDGSRPNAGPIESIRDVVNDRKISNLLEVQTGIFLNANDEFFEDASLVSTEVTREFGNFGTASDPFGRQRIVNGQKFRTLDPWRADYPAGTRLTFRSLFNHNTGLTPEQQADPYNLQKNNFRYFVFEFEVEVYDTPFGYAYVAGELGKQKTKWYKLVGIKYITGTDDFYNGEVVRKRMRDKAGRLYEVYLKICTEDDDKVSAAGAGLASNAETTEVVRTALPCEPPIERDEFADYRPTRFFRSGNFDEAMGHIPGTERNELVRQIVNVYNNFGNPEYIAKYKERYGLTYDVATDDYRDGRKYVDKSGMRAQVEGYLKYLDRLREGKGCEQETVSVTETVFKRERYPITLATPGTKGRGAESSIGKVDDRRIKYLDEDGDDPNATLRIKSTSSGVTARFSPDGSELIVKGDGAVTLQFEWDDNPNSFGQAVGQLKIGDLTFNQRGKKGKQIETLRIGTASTKTKNVTREKVVQPLPEDEYRRYRDDFRIVNKEAFNCLRRDILRFLNGKPKISDEKHYCEYSQEFVEEVRTKFKLTGTQAYELPCGGEIVAPVVTDPPAPAVATYPTILIPDEVVITSTGQGYNPGDTLTVNGIPGDFTLDPNGRIIGVTLPDIGPVLDYPVVQINSDTGAGADIAVTLKTSDLPADDQLDPARIVEVIDCVGKNIFTVES